MKKTIVFILLLSLLLATCISANAASGEPTEKIRVGWFPYPLSSEVHDGKYSGYTYDYLMELAKYVDWEYEFVEADFAACCEMLKNGELDIIGGLQHTPERDQVYEFADIPFSQTYVVMFTQRDSALNAYDYSNYDNMRVGILSGTNNRENVTEFAADNGFTIQQILEYDSNEALHAALAAGEVDTGVLLSYIASEDTKVIAKFAPISIYFVTTLGNKEVLSELNRAMMQVKINNADFESKLYQKYYVDEESVELTDEELAIVQASQQTPVTVGVFGNCSPISYWNEDTQAYDGLLVGIFNAICKKIGLNVSYVPMDAPGERPAAPTLILGVPTADGADEDACGYFSDPLLQMPLSMVCKSGKGFSWGEDAGSVAVVEGFSLTCASIQESLPGTSAVEYATLHDCLSAVADGRADAAVYYQSCLLYCLQDPHFSELQLASTAIMDTSLCVSGQSEAERSLLHIIDKGMSRISENELRSITLNKTMLGTYPMTVGDTLYKFRAPIIVIFILFMCVVSAFVALFFVKKRSSAKLKTAYEQVNQALIEAERASAAKGSFMSRMSHEIRTPLNAVIGYNTIARSEMAQAKTEAERRHAEMKTLDCLTKCDVASRHLLTILNDVLDMSAIESGKIKVVNERFDFKGLISSLTAIFYSQAKSKGVCFNVEFDAQMEEWVIGDQMRVNQIITNLLSNAIKFTPDGGSVTLFLHPQTQQEKIRLQFEVRDTGIGMSEEYMARIWSPFEQADSGISRRFGGTGLGLSITKSLVDLLGGSISVTSREGEGSTFFVSLELSRTGQPVNTGVYDFSSIHALVVDDDPSTCDYIRLLFSRSGVSSAAVNSGEEAICAVKKAIADEKPYTICLVDWKMPRMDGLETISRIREIAGKELPIIVVTAYDFTEVADKAAEVGVNMFISKPLFQSSLFNLLANLCGNPLPDSGERHSAFDFSGAKVLLAEDNAMNMEIAQHMLQASKLSVECAWNGQEAVDKFLSAPSGTYKAVLMDVQMPVMDGYQATRAIRASAHPQAASVPIIAMTADAFAENIAESHSAGMNDHISKPIDVQALLTTLRRYIP